MKNDKIQKLTNTKFKEPYIQKKILRQNRSSSFHISSVINIPKAPGRLILKSSLPANLISSKNLNQKIQQQKLPQQKNPNKIYRSVSLESLNSLKLRLSTNVSKFHQMYKDKDLKTNGISKIGCLKSGWRACSFSHGKMIGLEKDLVKKKQQIKFNIDQANSIRSQKAQNMGVQKQEQKKKVRNPFRAPTYSILPKSKLSLSSPSNLYQSIRNYNKQQQLWLYHLHQQLSLIQTIQQFQKIQLNRNIQPSKKLTMRQAYQLKKELVGDIQREKDITQLKQNIYRLAEIAIDQKEKDKFFIISFFIQLRTKLFKKPNTAQHISQQPNHHTVKLPNQSAIKQFNIEQSNLIKQSNIINQTNQCKQLQTVQENLKQIKSRHKNKNKQAENEKQKILQQQNSKFMYKREIIETIKQQIKQWSQQKLYHPNIMLIKILSILSLHLLKLQSPILSQPEIKLITCCIQLKKKSQVLLDYLSQEQKLSHLENLYFLVQQFYKYLYYQKADENMLVEHFGLVKAFKEIFCKTQNWQRFTNKYPIQHLLLNMRPVTDGVLIYADIRARNQISFKQLQNQLRGQDNNLDQQSHRPPKIKVNTKVLGKHLIDENLKKMQQEDQQEQQDSQNQSSADISSQIQSHSSSVFEDEPRESQKDNKYTQKTLSGLISGGIKTGNHLTASKKSLKLDRKLTKNRSIVSNMNTQQSQKQQKPAKHKINEEIYNFPFIFIKDQLLYSCQFWVRLSDNNFVIQFGLKICKGQRILIYYQFRKIRNNTRIDDRLSLQKLLWKVFKKIFIINFTQQQNPSLMKQQINQQQHIQKYIPPQLLSSEYQQICVIHDNLANWLKTKPFHYKFNGSTIQLPVYNSQQITKYLQNYQFQRDRKLFTKRYGYLKQPSKRLAYSTVQAIYSRVYQQFFIQPKPHNQTQHQTTQQHFITQYFIILLKVAHQQINQFKFVKIKVQSIITHIDIFQLGWKKHLNTNKIQILIQLLRKIKNIYSITKNKLFNKIQKVLLQGKVIQKSKFPQTNPQPCSPNQQLQQYTIQQQFQMQLSNQYQQIPTNPNIKITQLFNEQKKQSKLSQVNRKKKQVSLEFNAKMFKISHKYFHVVQTRYRWGCRLLGLRNNLEFFQFNNLPTQQSIISRNYRQFKQQNLSQLKSPIIKQKNSSVLKQQYNYQLTNFGIYKIGVLLTNKTLIKKQKAFQYMYFKSKRPYLSKSTDSNQQIYKQNNQNNQQLPYSLQISQKNQNKQNNLQNSSINNDRFNFIKQNIVLKKIYQKLYKQNSIEFKEQGYQNSIKFYFLQIYVTFSAIKHIKGKNNQYVNNHQNNINYIVIQMTDLKYPCRKYYIVKESNKVDQILKQDFSKNINFYKKTYRDSTFELFLLPIAKMFYQNEYFQKKSKFVKQKVVSQASYYFVQQWLKRQKQIQPI